MNHPLTLSPLIGSDLLIKKKRGTNTTHIMSGMNHQSGPGGVRHTARRASLGDLPSSNGTPSSGEQSRAENSITFSSAAAHQQDNGTWKASSNKHFTSTQSPPPMMRARSSNQLGETAAAAAARPSTDSPLDHSSPQDAAALLDERLRSISLRAEAGNLANRETSLPEKATVHQTPSGHVPRPRRADASIHHHSPGHNTYPPAQVHRSFHSHHAHHHSQQPLTLPDSALPDEGVDTRRTRSGHMVYSPLHSGDASPLSIPGPHTSLSQITQETAESSPNPVPPYDGLSRRPSLTGGTLSTNPFEDGMNNHSYVGTTNSMTSYMGGPHYPAYGPSLHEMNGPAAGFVVPPEMNGSAAAHYMNGTPISHIMGMGGVMLSPLGDASALPPPPPPPSHMNNASRPRMSRWAGGWGPGNATSGMDPAQYSHFHGMTTWGGPGGGGVRPPLRGGRLSMRTGSRAQQQQQQHSVSTGDVSSSNGGAGNRRPRSSSKGRSSSHDAATYLPSSHGPFNPNHGGALSFPSPQYLAYPRPSIYPPGSRGGANHHDPRLPFASFNANAPHLPRGGHVRHRGTSNGHVPRRGRWSTGPPHPPPPPPLPLHPPPPSSGQQDKLIEKDFVDPARAGDYQAETTAATAKLAPEQATMVEPPSPAQDAAFDRGIQDKALERKPYHPAAPVNRSDWVMWVGNVPSNGKSRLFFM